MQTKKTPRHSLLIIICISIILVTILTTLSVSLINFGKYREAVMTTHIDLAIGVSDSIDESMTNDHWGALIDPINQWFSDEITEDELNSTVDTPIYKALSKNLQSITDGLKLSNIALFTMDIEFMNSLEESDIDSDDSDFMMFLMDFYPTSENRTDNYDYAVVDSWWLDYASFETYRNIFNACIEDREPYYTEETLSTGAVLLTVYHPVFNANGDFIAMIMVSQNIQDIDSFVTTFFVKNLIIGLGIAAVLIALTIFFFYRRIVHPLRLITTEANNFVSGDAAISEILPTIHTGDEIQRLSESFLQMEKDIKDYISNIEKVTSEKEHIRTELSVATRIQADMLPRVFPPYPDRPEFSIFASMDPAKEVGGDFYDFFFVDHDHFAMVIADVAGKGVPASLFMVIAKTLIKTRTQQGGTPSEILHDVNNILCEGNDENMFVTVWMAIIDLRTGKGVAANAGHEHPVRKNKGGEYELVEYRHSPAVALFPDLKFRQHDFEMQPGDRLFVYTDGLPEATNTHEELYGTERVLNLLNSHKDETLENILPMVAEDVNTFVGEAPQFDDLTLLTFEYYGNN